MNAGIKDVAAEAGVSVGTVSNVLNRPDIVAAATRDRVLTVIARLGFVRNETARQLRAGRSRSIGLVVLDVANPFFTDVARGAETVADANETIVMLCNTGEQPQRELRHLEMLEQLRVLGVLITPVNIKSPRIDAMISRGVPVVLVDRRAARRLCCSVSVNDVLGGRLAVAHLLGQGHRRIAFVGGPMSIQQVRERRVGAEQALGDAADELAVLETAALSSAAGRQAAEQLAALSSSRRPTGVFCANDLIALGMLQELIRRGLRVPDDIAIVGYDDIDNAAEAIVPLSSVRQPREQLGRTAAELLFQEVEEGTGHRHRQMVFDPELIARASSDLQRGRKRPVGGAPGRPAAAVT
ncbi:MAG: LacI family transcriptional regulator [Pseudonocardiales bacterium]|nr:LacI family transcriptional regulator [Pseudonocardiales bacterium]